MKKKCIICGITMNIEFKTNLDCICSKCKRSDFTRCIPFEKNPKKYHDNTTVHINSNFNLREFYIKKDYICNTGQHIFTSEFHSF